MYIRWSVAKEAFFYSLTILINARIDLLFVICSLRVTQRYDICILNITSMSFIYLKHVIRTAFNLVNPLKNRCLARVDLPKQPLPTIIFILEAMRGTDPLYSLIEFTKNHLWCFTQPTLHFFIAIFSQYAKYLSLWCWRVIDARKSVNIWPSWVRATNQDGGRTGHLHSSYQTPVKFLGKWNRRRCGTGNFK